MRKVYDGSDANDVQCQVSRANEGRNCNVRCCRTCPAHIYDLNLTCSHRKLKSQFYHPDFIRFQRGRTGAASGPV